LTPLSMAHGRSPMSGVKTGGAAPGSGGGVVRGPVERACCARDIPASAAAPAPSPRTLLKKLLRGFIVGSPSLCLLFLWHRHPSKAKGNALCVHSYRLRRLE